MVDTEARGRSGRLRIVSTPIGNLEDMGLRALRVLRESAVVAAEDTRVTRRLFARHDIQTPLVSFHAHSGPGRVEALLERLRAGEDVALVSDAGTPCVSDPGGELVSAAIASGIVVEPVPGPSAVLAALVASGIDPTRFVFEGFLPRTNDRRERINGIAVEQRTIVFYESALRLGDTLRDLAEACGGHRQACVARELTKLHEEFVRGSLDALQERFEARPARGECVIVLEGGDGTCRPPEALDVDGLLRSAIARGLSAKDAARDVARSTGLGRRECYARAVRFVREDPSAEEPAREGTKDEP